MGLSFFPTLQDLDMEKSHIAGVEEFSILLELSPGDSYRIRWFVGSDPVFSEAVPWSFLGDFIGGIWKNFTISLGCGYLFPQRSDMMAVEFLY